MGAPGDVDNQRGVLRYNPNLKFKDVDDWPLADILEKHTGIRYAAGLEYKLTHRLSFDAFLRYVDFDYDSAEDFVEDLAEIGIGLKISF